MIFQYKRAPTKAPVENNYHEMKPLNSTTPTTAAPKITVNDENERQLIKSKEGINGDVPSESTPMLPNDDTYPIGNSKFYFVAFMCNQTKAEINQETRNSETVHLLQ